MKNSLLTVCADVDKSVYEVQVVVMNEGGQKVLSLFDDIGRVVKIRLSEEDRKVLAREL